MFGSLARRYSSPINIILITTVILIFPFIRLKIVNALKNKKYYFDLDIIIYYVLLIPTLIWIYKFSLILSVSLILILTLIFVLLYFVFNKNYINKYLTFVLIIIFLIPALDRTIVNVVVTRDIYNSWEEVNKKVNEFTEQDSLVEIILSRNMNIEQAISLESNSILNHRNDIQYFVDASKAKQIKEFNDFVESYDHEEHKQRLLEKFINASANTSMEFYKYKCGECVYLAVDMISMELHQKEKGHNKKAKKYEAPIQACRSATMGRLSELKLVDWSIGEDSHSKYSLTKGEKYWELIEETLGRKEEMEKWKKELDDDLAALGRKEDLASA